MPADVPCHQAHTVCLCRHGITSWHDVAWNTWWCHPICILWHHWPSYDVIGFPYKRCHAELMGDSTWLSRLELDLLHLGLRVHAFDWLLRVLVHTGIDRPCTPVHRSLLPSSILIRVVITGCTACADAFEHADTSPWACTSTTLRAGFTGLSPFGGCSCALFKELLISCLEAYCCRGDTPSSCMAHITHIWMANMMSNSLKCSWSIDSIVTYTKHFLFVIASALVSVLLRISRWTVEIYNK